MKPNRCEVARKPKRCIMDRGQLLKDSHELYMANREVIDRLDVIEEALQWLDRRDRVLGQRSLDRQHRDLTLCW